MCPVNSLKTYLEATNKTKISSLFINQVGSKALTSLNISNILCQVIKAGDKQSFPSGYDVRKVASSLAVLMAWSYQTCLNTLAGEVKRCLLNIIAHAFKSLRVRVCQPGDK